jgi:hypothetical protein
MNGHFVDNGAPFSIGAAAGSSQKPLQIVLPVGLAAKYTAAKKPMPGLPAKWKNAQGVEYTITWINNFGLRPTGSEGFVQGSVAEDYEILLDKEPGKTLFYYSGGVRRFEAADLSEPSDMPGKIAARLRLGDPPIGWGS